MIENLFDLLEEGWKPRKAKTFYYGDYNGAIEWVVLKVGKGKMLAMSKRVLEWLPFDEKGGNDWSDSSLRTWLNGEFANEALCNGENIDDYLIFDTNENGDHVFLLDYDTAMDCYELFCKIGSSTPTMSLLLAYEDSFGDWYEDGNLPFWLLPENGEFAYVDVYADASLITDEDCEDSDDWKEKRDFSKPLGVRPVVWFKTDSSLYG